jgi:hypothetical protein
MHESLFTPPQMAKDENGGDEALATLLKAMENDHCKYPDSYVEFKTPNGMLAVAATEWEFIVNPRVAEFNMGARVYPERDGLREPIPEALSLMSQSLKPECVCLHGRASACM